MSQNSMLRLSRGGLPRSARTRRWRGQTRRTSRWAPYLFVAPTLGILVVFWLAPLLFSFYIAFTRWSGLGSPEWIGLLNFQTMMEDEPFRKAMFNTIWYAVVSVAVLVPLGLTLAVMMNSPRVRFKPVFRAIYFMPGVTAVVAISISFLLLFDDRFGLVNATLDAVGLGGAGWLSTEGLSKPTVVSVVIWASMGFVMLYYLAGLQAIPRDLLDAASVDGASRLQTFRYVVLPQLRPTTIFVVILSTITAIQIFTEPYLLTRGGPQDSSLSATVLLFRSGFQFAQLGYAAAIGIVIFAATLAVSLLQMRILGLYRSDDQ